MKLSQEKQQLAVIGLLLLWCTALITYCLYLGTNGLEIGLFWNLFLAALPLMWSAAFQSAMEGKRPIAAGVFFSLWLLFFPNAPYILTDLIHLGPRPKVPLWYLLVMLLACAATGTLFGYWSLLRVHTQIEKRFGVITGWGVTVASLLLCGFGIYLGRFLRWNSWDVFTNPRHLFRDIIGHSANTLPHPHPLSVTLIWGVSLIVGYLALRVLALSVPKS